MKKHLHHLFTALFLTLFLFCAKAQKSVNFNYLDANENFYTTQARLNKHFKKYTKELERERKEKAEGKLNVGAEEEEELAGYELYKRWENFMAPRVYPSGDKTLASKAYEEYLKYSVQLNAISTQNKNIGSSSSILSATWQPIGPMGDPSGGNVGRINAVRFDPTNVNGLWACAPDGGLWASSNTGASWTTNTDQLSVIGNSDVVFDPTNPAIMFLATGDGEAGDSYSIGVLKSTNGGASWSATGLAWTVSQGRRIHKLLINPSNNLNIFAATTIGLLRSTDGGVTWATVQTGNIVDAEFMPGNPNTIYAVSTSFFLSTNNGVTFSTITSGLPTAAANNRLAIAVTPANSSYVYVVASSNSNSGFLGFYQSTNNGVNFTSKATSPNLLGWASAGTDTGGQGWYTLSIAASPTNANEVVVGGVNVWRTTNGGTNWALFGHWTGSGAPYVHADVHDLIYKNGTTLYVGCDGGVFYTTNSGTSFTAINNNMNISQIYKIGLSTANYNLAITGLQDNGTNLFSGGWNQTMGGDGMACFIDRTNDAVMYGSQYSGSFNRSINGGGNWSAITTGLSGSAPWVSPWHQDPAVANTIYAGYSQMFKSTNQGTNWTQMATLGGSGQIVEFAVAPSNNQIIYVIQGNSVYKTINGGTSWSNVTGTLPTGSAQLTWVAIKDTDPNTAYVTFSGYSAGNKIFKTINGGTTWTNYSTGLPNLPTNCVTYWNTTTNDGVYVGCDVGVYYRDNSLASWTLYNAGLPNTSVRDLAIFYPLGKLRAATYGRGVWEADLYNNGTMAPIANFTSNKQVVCPGDVINFSDLSTFAPTTWSWVFQSGAPATSTVQNPSVTYSSPGTYSVSLSASNINGTSVMTKTLYIVVSSTNNLLPLVEGFQGALFPPTNWQNYDAGTDGLKWAKNTTVGKASTASLFYDNYNLNSSGIRDEFRTPKYNFTGYTNIKMYFDVAYARYDATYSDSLAVMVSTDCGITFTQQYLKGGVPLSTAPDLTSSLFVPNAAQWRTDTVYLSSYSGNSNVMIALQNRGRYGQGLYIDNINITGIVSGMPPTANFAYAVPNPCSGQAVTFSDLSTNVPNTWNWQLPGATPSVATVANPTVTFPNAGTYVVTLISANGNGSSTAVSQTISVGTTPTITVTNPSICYGASTVVAASGASSYSWNTGASSSSINVNLPSFTTVYTVTGTTGSCKTVKTSTVTVNPVPTVGTADSTICLGTFATLNANGAITYSWSNGATGSSISVNPSTSTSYTVTGSDGTCTNDNISNVTVVVCTGIANLASIAGSGVLIIPNPNNGKFNVKTDTIEGSTITIYNNIGQLIVTIPFTKNMVNIDLTKYGRGIYNLVFNTNTTHKTIKVVVD